MRGTFYIVVPETAPQDPGREEPTEAEALCDQLAETVGAKLAANGFGERAGTAKVTARFDAETGRAENFTLVGEHPMAEKLVRDALAESDLGTFAVAAVFETTALTVAQSFTWNAAYKLGVQDRIGVHLQPDTEPLEAADAYKSIEVYYDIDSIPDGYKHPLDFRNEAMTHIERALESADAGEWAGAEIGSGEINFGFEVEDFERAEKIVRAAVKGTPYEGIREITRFSYPEDMHAAE